MYRVFWADRAEVRRSSPASENLDRITDTSTFALRSLQMESLSTLSTRLSFDFVLRKHGAYLPFDGSSPPNYPTGKELYDLGNYWTTGDLDPNNMRGSNTAEP